MPEKVKKKKIMRGSCFYCTTLANNFQYGLCVCACMCAFILLGRKEYEILQKLLREENAIQK